MRASRQNTALVALLLSLLSAHCSSDSARGAGANISTGLPAAQKLSAFDDEDARAACEALNDGAAEFISDRELIRAQCASVAIRSVAEVNSAKTQVTLNIPECENAAASCEAEPAKVGIAAEDGRDESDCSDATANAQVRSCEATVAEYEACVSKVLGQAKAALAGITCKTGQALLESDGAAIKLDPQSFDECKLFLEKCPQVHVTASVGE